MGDESIVISTSGLFLANESITGIVLSLFAVTGKAVLSKQVAGLAHVSLEKIPAGRYVAKLLDARGKVLANKFVTLK